MRRIDWETYSLQVKDKQAILEIQEIVLANKVGKKSIKGRLRLVLQFYVSTDNLAVKQNMIGRFVPATYSVTHQWLTRKLGNAINRSLKKRKVTIDTYYIARTKTKGNLYLITLVLTRTLSQRNGSVREKN